jgi:hypothetical protein
MNTDLIIKTNKSQEKYGFNPKAKNNPPDRRRVKVEAHHPATESAGKSLSRSLSSYLLCILIKNFLNSFDPILKTC